MRHAAERQLQELGREMTVLKGERRFASALRRLRHRAISVKQRALDRMIWHREPPGDVAAAFPELVPSRRVH